MIEQTPIDTTDEVEEAMTDLQEIKRKSVSGVVSFLVRTAILQGIGLASAFILSIYFSPEDFGVFGFVTQIIGLLVFFSDIGLAAALVQKKSQPTLTDYRTAFTVQQILSWGIVLIAVLVCATGFVQDKTGWAGVWILMSLALSFPLASLKTVSSIMLERKLDFSKLVLPQIGEQIIFHGLLLFLAWKGMGATAYAYAIISRSIIGLVLMWMIQPWSIGFALNRVSLKELLGYGAKFQFNDFLARIKDQLFFLVLGAVLPLREFGYIQWAKNWSLYPYNLTVQNVMAITFPTFSRLQHNKPALQRAIEKSLFFITLVIFPLLVAMCVFIFPLTELIPRYSKWEPALLSFVFFTLSVGWAAVSTPLTNTLNAIGEINTSLKLMVMWTILTWVLTPLLMYFFGFNGVAMAALLIAFTSYIPIHFVKKIVPIRVWDQIWRQLLAAGAMAVIGVGVVVLTSTTVLTLLLGIVAAGAAYAGVVWLLGRDKVWAEFRSLRA